MSHYAVLAIINKPDELSKDAIESAIADVLEPHRDNEWDWFMVGGRWTGAFDGYDPDSDPANKATCELCGGTGDRATWRHEPRELQAPSGCNGCEGTGQKTLWPTDWRFRSGDTKPVSELTAADLDKFYAVVIEEYRDWFGGTQYQPWKPRGFEFVEREKPTLEWLQAEFGERLAVIVDCHN